MTPDQISQQRTSALRFAAVDAADPLPSWTDLAARAGCDLPPLSAPGDTGWTSEVEIALYWPRLTA